ncbi:MAG: carboxypeptidase regulatory-like domain-containing protein [Planctomycetes bacterium]|nr:carboxypeptidase regulatory-like domain-containing protein [Planctomycetota bacterium]
MSSSRFSGLNIALLAIAVASLMFGAYGMFLSGAATTSPSANTVGAAMLDEELDSSRDPAQTPLADKTDNKSTKTTRRDSAGSDTTSKTSDPSPTYNNSNDIPEVEVASNPSDSGNAEIHGVVLDPNGAPVANAKVSARRSDLEMKAPQFQENEIERYRNEVGDFLARTARETRTTTSDEQGAFAFKGLDETLAYDLNATCEGVGAGETSRVAAGDKVIILLSGESLLLGRVETADGKPVKSFSIRYWRQNRQWQASSRNFNDEEGKFSIPAKVGYMQLQVTATGFTHDKPKDVQVGDSSEEVVIVVDSAAILSGVVTDKEGNPLPGVDVSVGGGDERQRGWGQQNNGPSATTDSKGRYRFDTLAPKETKFTASLGEMSESSTITLTQGENKLDFQMDVGAVLRIRLTDPNGNPVEADQIWFQEKGNRGWPRPERMPGKEPGLAEYAGMKPGEYVMTVSAGGFPAVKQDIKVEGGSNEISIKFTNGAMLTGIVSSSTGSKIANISVRLRKAEEGPWGGWGTGRIAQVDAEGNYKLGPAEPGQWTLEVYSNTDWNNSVYTNTITLAEGENTQNISVDAGATVICKVVDEAGNSVSWANIQLQGVKTYNQNSNNDGTATISFVEVGSYTLIASSRGLASPSQFISLRAGDNQVTVTLQKPNSCRLTHVYPDTQASKAGMQVGDLVIEYNGATITSWGGLSKAIAGTKATDDVTVLIERGGSMLTLTLKGGYVGIEGTDAVR